MPKHSTVTWLMVLALGVALSTSAQLVPVQALSIGDGLPQSQVTALIRDPQGYLWVGTRGGLSRYNGDDFTTFTVRDGLPANRIHELMIDSRGRLWIGTGGGLAVVEDHAIRTIGLPELRGEWCGAALEGEGGTIVVGTEHGVRLISPTGDATIPPPQQLPKAFVPALARYNGGILVAYQDRIVFWTEDGKIQELPAPPPGWSALHALAVHRGVIWAGGGADGLWRRRDGSWDEVLFEGERIEDVWRLQSDPSGTIIVASNGGGLYFFGGGIARGGAIHLDRSTGLPSDVVNCAFRDAEDNLWVGTDIGGLVRLGGAAFLTVTKHDGLPDSCVFGMKRTPEGIWVGTLAGAALLAPGRRPHVVRTIEPADGLSHPVVWNVAATPDGATWFLTNLGIDRLTRGASRVHPLKNNALPENVFDMLVTSDGRLWVGGRSPRHGLAVRDANGSWHAIARTFRNEPVQFVRCLARRNAGGVWASLGNRIGYSEGKTVHLLEEAPPLPGRSWIMVLLEDGRGRLWAGNDTGLAVRSPAGKWSLMEIPDLAGASQVFSLAEDSEGGIWVGTSRGVLRIAPDGSTRLLTPEDGLAAFEANEHGLFGDRDGVVWIGTIGGLSRYDPSRDHPRREAPPLVVESASLPERTVPFPTELHLRWRERNVSFKVAILALRDHPRCGYRARMEGVDEGWLPVRSPRQELRYTNLPAGSTRLVLQPVSAAGIPGAEVVVPITVTAPIWATGWFQATVLFLLGLAALAGHRWRMAWLRRRARELEAEVDARTEELKELANRLEFLANHDILTGLPNRRLIWSELEEALRPRGGAQRRCGVLLLDLDRFKEVNDTFGHSEGDRVLREVARLLRDSIRPGDMVGRFGGDEFLVVLPGADREAVEAVAQRVGGISVRSGKGEGAVLVTISAGAVAVRGGGNPIDPRAVLLRADDLAYRVKKRGRAGWELEEVEGPSETG